MGLLDQIRKDAERFISNTNDFAVEMTFTDNAYNNAVVSGLYTMHHTKFEDGQAVDSKNASVCVSEKKLTDAGYVVRNADNEIIMVNHFVSFQDLNGTTKKFKITRSLPDETIGAIILFISDYAEN